MCAFKKFDKIVTTNSEINRLQTNIESSLSPIVQKPQLDSNILTGIILHVGKTNNVAHLLNRIPIGYKVINCYGESNVWNIKQSDSSFLYLACSATVTVDLEVS